MGKLLDGYPWWSQLTDIDPTTKRPDIFAASDCGEEVASIWIAGQTGKYTDAADLRRKLPGHMSTGTTNGAAMVEMLVTHGIHASELSVGNDKVEPVVKADLELGFPCALLGRWVSPDILHWILGVGFGNDALIAMEPWSGKMVCYRWSTVRALSFGTVVAQDGPAGAEVG